VTAAVLLLGYWAAMMLVPVPASARETCARSEPRRLSGPGDPGHQPPVEERQDVGPRRALQYASGSGHGASGCVHRPLDPFGSNGGGTDGGIVHHGNVGLVLGVIWHAAFPINKNIWTSST
jgi:hypothetical protein